MPFFIRPCNLEMDTTAYIQYLIKHQARLNLPYAFAAKLSFFSSPISMGRAVLMFEDEPYGILGAAGFVYGTGANDYEDRHICHVEVAYLQEEYRSTMLFMRMLNGLLAEMKAGNPGVSRVQFWIPANQEQLEKLCARFAVWPCSVKSTGVSGDQHLSFYSFSFAKLEEYCSRFHFANT